MNDNLIQLAQRREHLVAQAAAQRMTLSQIIEQWRAPLALADQGLAMLRFIKRHAVWVAGAGVLYRALRPGSGSIKKWIRRGWETWQITRKLRTAPEQNQ